MNKLWSSDMMNVVSWRIDDETQLHRMMNDTMVDAQNLALVGSVKAL